MALDSRNLSIEGVRGILIEGNAALMSLSAMNESNNLLMAIERLKQKALFLESLENKMLALFPAPNDRESVRQKVIEYNQTNFNNFFGRDLKQTFTDEFFKAANAVKGATQQEQNLLAQYIINEISKNLDSTIPKGEIAKEIAKEFNFTISAIITEGGTRFATRKTNIVDLTDKGPQILVDKLTPPMRERLQQILNQLNGEQSNYKFPNLNQVNLQNFQTSKNSISIKVSSEWFNNIQGMSLNTIKDKVTKNPQVWKPFVDKANNNIIELLKRSVSGEVRMYLDNYLRGMIANDPYIFFIGKSTTDLTGLLGEINAVLAIQKLTGKTVPVEWIAHNMADGKKVSIDVVLKSQLGINVKNTTQNFSQFEGFHNVKFLDRNPKNILDTLLDNTNYNEELSDAFQTSYFNVSYQIMPKRPHVVKGSNSDFDNLESGLLNFRQHLITYLYQFAPEMLYMATDDLDKQLLILDKELNNAIAGVGNILYMVGGVPFFPSEMIHDLIADLDQLYNDIQNGSRFRKKSFLFDIGGKSDNIIKVLNDRAKQKQSIALHDVGSHSLDSISVTQMTSSWLF